ncbi:hypothetical protein ACFL27_15005 [candidate division CSSED10-310 bacterium]|uniref:Integrase SAM-like N-terminal domain-containing protein n=1 Tax=candidate division CSSED10-310 bacterium TaxID=2855610 RepID=A0ABV6YZL1_UNCC1
MLRFHDYVNFLQEWNESIRRLELSQGKTLRSFTMVLKLQFTTTGLHFSPAGARRYTFDTVPLEYYVPIIRSREKPRKRTVYLIGKKLIL